MNACEVRGLCKDFSKFSLREVSFVLPQGYIMGYVGQNGAGKTTTINCINHICRIDAGEILVDGIHYEDDPVRYKESIGFIGDESYFQADMTVRDVRRILKSFYSTFREEDFDRMVQQWALPVKKQIQDFSRGMKVKLMFASVFSRDTRLLILDEATNGLDPVMREDILTMLQDYIADGERSVLFSTHQLEDLDQIADYIAFIDNGELLIAEDKDEMLESWLLVKGSRANVTPELAQCLVGETANPYGMEALLRCRDAYLLPNNFVVDKPDLHSIMIHIIKDRRRGI